jgi:hypothetical protein
LERTEEKKTGPKSPDIFRKLSGIGALTLDQLQEFADEGIIVLEKEGSGAVLTVCVRRNTSTSEYRWTQIAAKLKLDCGFDDSPVRGELYNTWSGKWSERV